MERFGIVSNISYRKGVMFRFALKYNGRKHLEKFERDLSDTYRKLNISNGHARFRLYYNCPPGFKNNVLLEMWVDGVESDEDIAKIVETAKEFTDSTLVFSGL